MAIEERLHEAETGTRVALENEFIKRLGSMNNELHSKNRGEQKNALRQLIKVVEVTNASIINVDVRL